jgi:Dipeptide/tripeptide permease
MILSFLWFWFGRRQLRGIGEPPAEASGSRNMGIVLIGAAILVPIVSYCWPSWRRRAGLGARHIVRRPFGHAADRRLREGAVPRDKVIAMLIIFVFNILFWMFYEQAGSSFNFLRKRSSTARLATGSFRSPGSSR